MEPGLKVTTYFGENARSGRHLLSDIFGDLYEANGVETAILQRAVEGFGAGQLLRTDRSTDIAFNLPLVSTAVGEAATIERIIPELRRHLGSGLLTTARVTLLRGLPEQAVRQVGSDDVKAALYLGRRERAGNKLAFVRAVEILRNHGVSGGTVVLGLDGMTHGVRRRARFGSANRDVPVRVTSIGSSAAVEAAGHELGEVLNQPPMTLERVSICKRDGASLGPPPRFAGPTVDGRDQWRRLTVYVASGAKHERRPLGYELIRRLHRANAPGATLTRGIWGYSGDHAPHGDRGSSVVRDSPTTVTVICSPAEADRLWPMIDELTHEHGLVTAETVSTI
jgi:PII-like signaling protein